MKLQHKTFLMLFVVICLIVGIISIVYSSQSQASLESQLKSASMDMALTVASMTEVQEGLAAKENDHKIQKLLLPLMESTRYQYIIVIDMDGIQYSYPYESGLYKSFKAGDSTKVLTEGTAYVSFDNNELISAIRAFAPIFKDQRQVGAVLVGLLTTEAKEENQLYVTIMEVTLVFGVFLGIIIAIFFSINIKKTIFGLEPKEIAILLTEKELIFQNIERGILSVNNEGQINLCNSKATTLLGQEDMLHQKIDHISPYLASLITKTIDKDLIQYHEVCVLESGIKVLLHICSIKNSNNQVIGHVISMEDMTKARLLAEELTDYRTLIDSLRAQNHEFMNKLQTISGLIQLEDYKRALDYIEGQAKKNHHFRRFLSHQIKESNIAALLLVKYELASEKKIQLIIDEDSSVTALPNKLLADDLCTIVGNLIDNSIEALKETLDGTIHVFIHSNVEHFELEVSNNGPFLDESTETLFTKGYSSKGEDRGYGLFLIKSILDQKDGQIYWKNDEMGVTWFVKI